MADPFTPYLPGQEVAKSIGQSFIPEYLKNPNVHGLAPNAEWKTPRSQPDNPLPWLGLDAASMIPGGATKLAALKLAPLWKFVGPKGRVADYAIHDNGNAIGKVFTTLKGNNLTVDSLQSQGGPNSLGTVKMRELLRALRSEHPEAEKVHAMRTGGANPYTVKDLKLPSLPEMSVEEAQRLLGPDRVEHYRKTAEEIAKNFKG